MGRYPTFTARAPVSHRAAEHRLLIVRQLWGRRDMMQAAIDARRAEKREEKNAAALVAWMLKNGATTTALRTAIPENAGTPGPVGSRCPGVSGPDLGGELTT
jgi:hypothetical protein